MNKSVQTISNPEFVNLKPTDLNPMVSQCDIKVLYVGGNRNGSYISKEVATEMSKTLRGAMIVGYYKEDKQDFADHGDVITIDDEGIHFECKTTPYGFVAPDSKVWFQNFEDEDDFGNVVTHEYLMTNGYLWTGHFPELSPIFSEGRPQSMELDGDNLQGKWSTDPKTGLEFFIINDAVFSKLCILGEDVEPCFEGANLTSITSSKNFSLNNNITLYSMMKDLERLTLEGGKTMDEENTVMAENVEINNPVEEEVVVVTEPEQVEETTTDEIQQAEENSTTDNAEVETVDFTTQIEEKYVDKNEYEELNTKYTALLEECEQLRAFKAKVEDKEKDEMINSFYMLSDEDKAEIIKNKSNYTLDEIESKLSVICVRKKVNFNLEQESENTNKAVVTTFNVAENDDLAPAWIVAARNNKNNY